MTSKYLGYDQPGDQKKKYPFSSERPLNFLKFDYFCFCLFDALNFKNYLKKTQNLGMQLPRNFFTKI